jgi:arylsulfatase A-like enzyme
LVALERARVDHIGAYGRQPSPTPVLDFLAQSGVRFTNAYSPAPGGTTSARSLLSGNTGAEGPPLQEILQREGYVTIASLNDRDAADPVLRRGFLEIDDAGGTPEARVERLFGLITSRVMGEKPIFVFYQAALIEGPYENAAQPSSAEEARAEPIDFELLRGKLRVSEPLDDPTRQQLDELYSGELRRANLALIALMRPLRKWGFYDRYLTIVTAVGGEELGERGSYSPAGSLYDEMLRVPLILNGNNVDAGGVRDELVSTTDIAPTILRYVRQAVPDAMSSRDLLDDALLSLESVQGGFESVQYVRTREWKLIDDGEAAATELYNLVADPQERQNRAAEEQDVVKMLKGELTR